MRQKNTIYSELEQFIQNIQTNFSFHLNQNQKQEIKRLVYELCSREKILPQQIENELLEQEKILNVTGKNKFFQIKYFLIKKRFPSAKSKKANELFKDIFLPPLPTVKKKVVYGEGNFIPKKIFLQKGTMKLPLVKNIIDYFPEAEVREIKSLKEYAQNNRCSPYNFKEKFLVIVNEQWDFIRPCPCTKKHISCGYWILNIGFGCPFDCSYCYLQQYTNLKGIVIPANLEDFFQNFELFYKKINRPIRIGTGEFSDSLALDYITGYSKQLIDFFRDKNVLFELKTKSNCIKNLLLTQPSESIIISFSLSTPKISKEELGTANIEQRLEAAKQLQKHGYKLAFHFDPIIHYLQWEKDYAWLIQQLYSILKPPFAWISLGTLRGNRKLKSIWERRFPESDIFYGELLLTEDKKLRYPRRIRKTIYKFIVDTIRKYDQKTPIYLCMEEKKLWQQIINPNIDNTKRVEKYLITGKI